MIWYKSLFYSLIVALTFFSCQDPQKGPGTFSKDSLKNVPTISDTATVSDPSSTGYFADSLFADLTSEFKIFSDHFAEQDQLPGSSCYTETNHFMGRSDIFIEFICNEICETRLTDNKSRNVVVLPCSYDAGIAGVVPSPGCDKFIVIC